MKRSGMLKSIAAAAALPVLAPIANAIAPEEAAITESGEAVYGELAMTTEPFWLRFPNGALLRTDLTSMSRLSDCIKEWGSTVAIRATVETARLEGFSDYEVYRDAGQLAQLLQKLEQIIEGMRSAVGGYVTIHHGVL